MNVRFGSKADIISNPLITLCLIYIKPYTIDTIVNGLLVQG